MMMNEEKLPLNAPDHIRAVTQVRAGRWRTRREGGGFFFFFLQLLITTPRRRSSRAATVTLLLACLLVDPLQRPPQRKGPRAARKLEGKDPVAELPLGAGAEEA